jgi:hypothetical protein
VRLPGEDRHSQGGAPGAQGHRDAGVVAGAGGPVVRPRARRTEPVCRVGPIRDRGADRPSRDQGPAGYGVGG